VWADLRTGLELIDGMEVTFCRPAGHGSTPGVDVFADHLKAGNLPTTPGKSFSIRRSGSPETGLSG
jgi:hypothetical protein